MAKKTAPSEEQVTTKQTRAKSTPAKAETKADLAKAETQTEPVEAAPKASPAKASKKNAPAEAATKAVPAKATKPKSATGKASPKEAPEPSAEEARANPEEDRSPTRPAPKVGVVREDDLQKRLTPEEVEEFRRLLTERRQALIESARETLEAQENMDFRAPDEVDQASTEYDQSLEYRMRDREKFLLRKIEKALLRIEEGEYDLCESCGNPIGRKRLLARPETTFCIVCKEEQERQEKMFQKRRQIRATLDF